MKQSDAQPNDQACGTRPTVGMQLPPEGLESLREALRADIGEEGLKRFTDEGLNDLGIRMLHLTAIGLKIRARQRRERRLWEKQKERPGDLCDER